MKTGERFFSNQHFLTHIILPLTVGCGIYVLLRKSSIFFIETWIPYYLPDSELIEFIKYNLPDGLWLYSLTNLMIMVWGNKISGQSLIWICSIPILGFLTEILQANHLFQGTYDINDLMVYGAASFFSYQNYNVKYIFS